MWRMTKKSTYWVFRFDWIFFFLLHKSSCFVDVQVGIRWHLFIWCIGNTMFRCDEGLMRSKIRRSISEKRRNQNKVPQTLFQAWVQKSSLSNYSDKNYEIWNLIDLKCLSFLKQVLWKFKMKRVPGTIIWRFRPKKFVRLTNFVKKITNNYTFSSLITVQYCQISFIR